MRKRRFTGMADSFSKRALFGMLNSFFGTEIIASDTNCYTLPFIHSFRSGARQKHEWTVKQAVYEYDDEATRKTTLRRFEIVKEMLARRVDTSASVYDVGCNSGFNLELFQRAGFTKLYGVDPQVAAIDYIKEHRPYIDAKVGYFGLPANDRKVDLMTFFASIDRVPYPDKPLDAIRRCDPDYVLLLSSEFHENFRRDWHYEFARAGYMCVEKHLLGENGERVEGTGPYVFPGRNGSLMLFRKVANSPIPV